MKGSRADRFVKEAHAANMTVLRLQPPQVPSALQKQGLLQGKGVRQSSPLLDALFPQIPVHSSPEEADFGVVEGICGVAETGTVILGPPRKLSLVPDRLIVVLPENRVVESLPEALSLLNPSRVSAYILLRGPSVTADIEKKIVHGVHGPREVTVVLLT